MRSKSNSYLTALDKAPRLWEIASSHLIRMTAINDDNCNAHDDNDDNDNGHDYDGDDKNYGNDNGEADDNFNDVSGHG